MADKKINELPVSSGLTDNALLPVYQNDQTHSITGALIKSFAVAAAKLQADAAAKSADAAAGSASTASGNAQTAGTAASAAGKSAQAAQTAKTAAETAKNGAEAARTAIENMLVEAITLASGQSATVSKSLVDQVVKLTFGLPAGPAGKDGAKGEPGRDGTQGPQGVGITSIDRTSGNGTPGTTDTYTIALSNGTSYTFTVYNGANGMGSGDFMASGSVAMTGNLRMGGHRMTGVGAPQADDDAVRRMDLTANNVKFADGENFQQKLDSGELTGPAGRDGQDGAPGTPGKDGKSAYQAAVEKGYTGTEEEFNTALAGMKDAPFLPIKGGALDADAVFTIPGDGIFQLGGGEQNPGVAMWSESPGRLFVSDAVINGVADPESTNDAANKGYVDGLVGNINSVLDAINGEVV